MKEFLQKESIQFVGVDDEDEFEKSKANETAINTMAKIKKMYKGEANLVIHVKRYEVEGKRKKYSIHARLRSPGEFFEANEVDWDFLNAIQAALSTLFSEVKKRHQKETTKKI